MPRPRSGLRRRSLRCSSCGSISWAMPVQRRCCGTPGNRWLRPAGRCGNGGRSGDRSAHGWPSWMLRLAWARSMSTWSGRSAGGRSGTSCAAIPRRRSSCRDTSVRASSPGPAVNTLHCGEAGERCSSLLLMRAMPATMRSRSSSSGSHRAIGRRRSASPWGRRERRAEYSTGDSAAGRHLQPPREVLRPPPDRSRPGC